MNDTPNTPAGVHRERRIPAATNWFAVIYWALNVAAVFLPWPLLYLYGSALYAAARNDALFGASIWCGALSVGWLAFAMASIAACVWASLNVVEALMKHGGIQ